MSGRDPIRAEVSRIHEDAEYTGQANFIASVWLSRVNLLLGIPTTLIAAAAGAFALSNHASLAGALAVAAALTAALHTFIGAPERAARRQRSGTAYTQLRNEARIFLNVDLPNLSPTEAREGLRVLASRRDELNRENVPVPDWLFKRAQQKINRGDLLHEIDQLQTNA
jgi:hypothetical protein